jgi:tripartite-type tricarboxylate transporter receptor subunit TctC
VPPVADTLPGFDFSLWGGYFAPRATPDDVVRRLNAEINRIVTEPELKARFEAEGSAATPMTPERFDRFVRDEVAKYARLIKATGTILE